MLDKLPVNDDALNRLVSAVATVDEKPQQSWVGGVYGKWGRPQYLALLRAVGTRRRARALADDMITWKKGKRPPDEVLDVWEQEFMQGIVEPSEQDVRRMQQQLIAREEWENRAAIAASRNALIKLAEKAEKGDLDAAKQVQLQYLGMNTAYITKETAAAFGTPKPTVSQMNQIVINAGENPHKPRQLKTPRGKLLAREREQVIDAEVREIIGSTDG